MKEVRCGKNPCGAGANAGFAGKSSLEEAEAFPNAAEALRFGAEAFCGAGAEAFCEAFLCEAEFFLPCEDEPFMSSKLENRPREAEADATDIDYLAV